MVVFIDFLRSKICILSETSAALSALLIVVYRVPIMPRFLLWPFVCTGGHVEKESEIVLPCM